MKRVHPDILEDLDVHDRTIPAFRYSPAEARYGADLLGRAIGHENFGYEAPRGIDPTLFYTNLVHEVIASRTHRIMAFEAARSV